MIDVPTNTLKLVEYNAIAASFGCLSNKVRRMHNYVHSKYRSILSDKFNYQDLSEKNYDSLSIENDPELSSLPWHGSNNSFVEQISESFYHAITAYSKEKYDADRSAWVLFVCEDDERNLCD